MSAPRTVEEAIAYCASHLTTTPDGCQMECRTAYGVPSNGTPSAAADWKASKYKHATTDPMAIPRGALVRWTGGSHGYGHVAIAVGNGMCWSTDLPVRGRRGLVAIDSVHKAWGLSLVGWTEDIDGVRVWSPPPAPAPPRPSPLILPRRATGNVKPRQIPKWTGSFYHNDTPAGAGYHGLAVGRKRGYLSADMNFNACKPTLLHPNGVLINTHWPRTGHDHFTGGGVTGDVAFKTLSWRKVRALHTPQGYRIHSITQIIRRAKQDGYTHLEIELKDGVDHLSHKQLTALIKGALKVADSQGIAIYFKTLSNIGNPLKRVRAIHAAGGVSVLLPRESPHLKKADWWPVLDYVREGVGPNKVTWE